METQSLYNTVIFLLPSITVNGTVLTNVYGRILTVFYNTKTQQGVIGLEVGDSVSPQVKWLYEIEISITPTSSISAQELIGLVLVNIPNSSILP